MRAMLLFGLVLAACSPSAAPPSSDVNASAQEGAQAPASTATASPEAALATMPSWENARAQGVDFRAVGQEPGWLLDIYTADRMVLVWDYGDHRLETPRGTPTYPQEGATRFAAQNDGHQLIVTIRRVPCNDGMSGQAYPSTVEVMIDGRRLTGCGRSV